MARWRITAKSGTSSLRTVSIPTWRSVSSRRGFMQIAAATTGKCASQTPDPTAAIGLPARPARAIRWLGRCFSRGRRSGPCVRTSPCSRASSPRRTATDLRHPLAHQLLQRRMKSHRRGRFRVALELSGSASSRTHLSTRRRLTSRWREISATVQPWRKSSCTRANNRCSPSSRSARSKARPVCSVLPHFDRANRPLALTTHIRRPVRGRMIRVEIGCRGRLSHASATTRGGRGSDRYRQWCCASRLAESGWFTPTRMRAGANSGGLTNSYVNSMG